MLDQGFGLNRLQVNNQQLLGLLHYNPRAEYVLITVRAEVFSSSYITAMCEGLHVLFIKER